MATSKNKLEEFHTFLEDECCCPICLDEFIEPKSLSNCLHNVCENCLKKMCRSDPYSFTIQCPVCREVSRLPSGGVSAMPTNKLLVRLIEKAPGRQEKLAIKKALEETKRKVLDMKQNLEGVESVHSRKTELAKHIRVEIVLTAENLIAKIQEQKKRLLAKVEEYSSVADETEFLKKKGEMGGTLERATKCVEVVEEILRIGNPAELIEMKETVLLQLKEFNSLNFGIYVDFDSVEAEFESNSELEDLLEKKGIGQLHLQSKFGAASADFDFNQASACGGACGGDTKKRGTLIDTLNASDFGESEFTPFAVAVSQSTGDIAILSENRRKVFVLNETGQKVCTAQIQYGDLHDVAFSRDGDLIVVNYESSRLLHYGGKDGLFKRKRVEPSGSDIKFKLVSVDVDGRLVVSCDEEDADDQGSVQVYDHNRNFLFSFGEGDLAGAGKAVFHDGEFFVADGDCIKVFDHNGVFTRQFGDFFDTSGLDIDQINENILISDHDDNTMYIYELDGTFVAKWETSASPTSLALTKTGKIYVTCWEGNCVQCFSYA